MSSAVPPPWSILCGVEGVAVGTAVFGWGFARFSGRRLRRSTCLLALGLLAVGLALLQQVATPHAFATLFDAICLSITGWIVVGQRHYLTAPKNRAEFVLGVAIWLYALSWLIRGAASAANDGPVNAHKLYVGEPFLAGYAIFYGTIPIIIISALMLNMVNAHLNERLLVHAATEDLTGLRTRRALRGIERSALRGAVERRPFETGTAPRIALTVSIGLAFWLDSEALELALRRADDALYGAKAAGRNRVRVALERVA